MHTLAARTFVNQWSTKVVPENSPEAYHFLGNAGDEISDETAARLGLTDAPGEDLSKLTKTKLAELAAERGVGIDDGATKAEIIEALEAADVKHAAQVETAETSA